jgi:copper chaperone CopZ
MNLHRVFTVLAATLLAANLAFAETTQAKPAPGAGASVLKEGTYTAKVKALACSACPPEVQKALGSVKGVRSVSVDAEKKTVQFTVDKGTTVSEAEIQRVLKAASEQMGMGADYSLLDIKMIKT